MIAQVALERQRRAGDRNKLAEQNELMPVIIEERVSAS